MRSRTLLLAMLTCFAIAGPARADDEAVKRFERGVQLYEAENYEGALVEFNTAYRLSKNFKLLYNIGICQTAMKDYSAATDTFTKYLAEGGADVSEARKTDVQERLRKLSLMVTQVRITTDAPPGATLLVDGVQAGTTPLPETIPVKIGRRTFVIRAGGRTATRTVDVISGDDRAAVSLLLAESALAPGPAPATASEPAAKARGETTSGPSFPWPFWALTGLLGGGAAVTGILTVEARNDLEEKQATFGVPRSVLRDEQSRMQTLGYVTDGLLIGTVIAAGVSTWLTIRYYGNSGNRKRSTARLGPGWSF